LPAAELAINAEPDTAPTTAIEIDSLVFEVDRR
jgi:hypothetical protein